MPAEVEPSFLYLFPNSFNKVSAYKLMLSWLSTLIISESGGDWVSIIVIILSGKYFCSNLAVVGSSGIIIPSATSLLFRIFAIRSGGSVIEALSMKSSLLDGIEPAIHPFLLYGAAN